MEVQNMTEIAENNNKFTNLDLKIMQNWDLDKKIATSLTRIAEFNTHFNNKTYILLFDFNTN
jgi:hypothetical protein